MVFLKCGVRREIKSSKSLGMIIKVAIYYIYIKQLFPDIFIHIILYCNTFIVIYETYIARFMKWNNETPEAWKKIYIQGVIK